MLPVVSCRITSVETPENRIFGRIGNTGPIISDRNKKIAAVLREGKCDISIFRYITDSIVKKDSKYLADSFRVIYIERKFIFRREMLKFSIPVHYV